MFPKLDKLPALFDRADALIERVESLLPTPAGVPDFGKHIAARWRRHNSVFGSVGVLEPIATPHRIAYSDLHDIDSQRERISQNTLQFVRGFTANNVLLSGSRGTGKSSLIKATLHAYAREGLRLVEMDRLDLIDLPSLVALIAPLPYKFVVFSDDLSFEAGDSGFKALKSVLDGSLAGYAPNVLIYATSNRRHLMPEFMHENLEYKHTSNGEIHPGETSEEKISLSERFGLWLSFYPFDQEQYLTIARHWVGVLHPAAAGAPGLDAAAKLWALERASRSGRVAYQFARAFAGEFEHTHSTERSKPGAKPRTRSRTKRTKA
jgi:uncharacterized protein